MQQILFPTVAAADAFIADLQSRGVVQPEVGSMTLNRRSTGGLGSSTSMTGMGATGSGAEPLVGAAALNADDDGSTAEAAGDGALTGTAVGLASGAAVGAIGTATGVIGATAATVATGGLALPVILGMAALGSGVGAAVGAAAGAASAEAGHDSRYPTMSEVDDDHYGRIDSAMNAGGRAVAVDDNVPRDVLEDAVRAHGGQLI